jgi:hypothetical protein
MISTIYFKTLELIRIKLKSIHNSNEFKFNILYNFLKENIITKNKVNMVGDDLGTAKKPISIGQAIFEPSKVRNAKEKIEVSLLLVSSLHKCLETEAATRKLQEALFWLNKYEEIL